MSADATAAAEAHEDAEKQTIDQEEERRKSALANMETIEKKFTNLKDQLFETKLASLNAEFKQLEDGTHEGCLTALEELKRVKNLKQWQAREWLELQQQNIATLYAAEVKQAEDEYFSDATALKQQLRDQLSEQRRRLQEDRANLTLQAEDTERVAPRSRVLRKRSASSSTNAAGPHGHIGEDGSGLGGQSELNLSLAETLSAGDAAAAKRARTAPPHIQYMLEQEDITNDLSVIQSKVADAYAEATTQHAGKGDEDMMDATSLGAGISVLLLDDALLVGNESFAKGSLVNVVSVSNGSSFQGRLSSISAADCTVVGDDSSERTVTLASLRAGARHISLVS